jgi:hypothetical protein
MATIECKERHWLLAIALQIGIRVRYALGNFFGLKALFMPVTAYPSKWRPKSCPKYDFLTQTGFIWLWFIAAFAREYSVFYVIFAKTGILYLMNAFHKFLSDRLISQFKAAGYTSANREMKIPDYDWKNGTPDEFYKTFVARPHPVILRGFMKDTQLLKDLNWDSVLSKYGDEDVFLTKRELDGFPGKLKEVNNSNVYLHNSEKLFSKYPAIRYNFSKDSSLTIIFLLRY